MPRYTVLREKILEIMRTRRKKNLEEKIEKFEGKTLFTVRSDDLNFKTSLEKKEYLDLYSIFGRRAPLELEIGSGKGGFICETAKRNPGTNFIGVEAERNVAYMSAKKIFESDEKNVIILNTLAEYLPKYIHENSCEKIYLNFSCPYPKADYESHRLTSEMFLKIYDGLLKKDGVIIQKTDDRKFFEYSIESFSSFGFRIRNVSLNLHEDNDPENIVTEYEKKFVEMGKPIYRLEAHR